MPSRVDTRVGKYEIWLCQACIDGIGDTCHTPGCALCRHKVDLPIHREGLTELVPPHDTWGEDDTKPDGITEKLCSYLQAKGNPCPSPEEHSWKAGETKVLRFIPRKSKCSTCGNVYAEGAMCGICYGMRR